MWDAFSGDVYSSQIKVFLCGPGLGSPKYESRKKLKEFLETISGVEVILGEDLFGARYRFLRSTLMWQEVDKDLLTAELKLALHADLIVLMPESPGAFAELGTFCAIPGIRKKLFVAVDEVYHGEKSFISRGPLSILVKNNRMAVSYYKSDQIETFFSKVRYAVSFAKYVKSCRFSLEAFEKVLEGFDRFCLYYSIYAAQPVDLISLRKLFPLHPSVMQKELNHLMELDRCVEKLTDGKYVIKAKLKSHKYIMQDKISMFWLSRLRARVIGI